MFHSINLSFGAELQNVFGEIGGRHVGHPRRGVLVQVHEFVRQQVRLKLGQGVQHVGGGQGGLPAEVAAAHVRRLPFGPAARAVVHQR